MAGERPGHSLQATALVNEAYLKLVDQSNAGPKDRAHFLAIAAVAMRHILIDRARARAARKRGGGNAAVTLDADAIAGADDPQSLLDINDALERVARLALILERQLAHLDRAGEGRARRALERAAGARRFARRLEHVFDALHVAAELRELHRSADEVCDRIEKSGAERRQAEHRAERE